MFELNDGGRGDAGLRGNTRDCVTRAIAIALELPYREVYDALNALAKAEKPRAGKRQSNARLGVHRHTCAAYLKTHGWQWTPTMQVGKGCQVHLRADELPAGRILVKVSRHLVAVIDGVIHDTHDPSRGGTRCVYGYYRKPIE